MPNKKTKKNNPKKSKSRTGRKSPNPESTESDGLLGSAMRPPVLGVVVVNSEARKKKT